MQLELTSHSCETERRVWITGRQDLVWLEVSDANFKFTYYMSPTEALKVASQLRDAAIIATPALPTPNVSETKQENAVTVVDNDPDQPSF